MSKDIKIPRRQGNYLEITHKYAERFIDGGKLCYGCDEVRDLDNYYKGITICKPCCSKKEKDKWKKQKQPLW